MERCSWAAGVLSVNGGIDMSCSGPYNPVARGGVCTESFLDAKQHTVSGRKLLCQFARRPGISCS